MTVTCVDCGATLRIPDGGIVPTVPRCYPCGRDKHLMNPATQQFSIGDRVTCNGDAGTVA